MKKPKYRYSFNHWLLGRWAVLIEVFVWAVIALYMSGDTLRDTRVFFVFLAFYVLGRVQLLVLETNRQVSSIRQATRAHAEFLEEHYSRDNSHEYTVANAIVGFNHYWKDPCEEEVSQGEE